MSILLHHYKELKECISEVERIDEAGRVINSSKISRCNICATYFDSKRQLRKHIDKDHRITDSKLVAKK